jgi:hypothetical protein
MVSSSANVFFFLNLGRGCRSSAQLATKVITIFSQNRRITGRLIIKQCSVLNQISSKNIAKKRKQKLTKDGDSEAL